MNLLNQIKEQITIQQYRALLEKCKSIGRMLGKMMNNPDSFCGRNIDK
jgi:hypothetical protein